MENIPVGLVKLLNRDTAADRLENFEVRIGSHKSIGSWHTVHNYEVCASKKKGDLLSGGGNKAPTAGEWAVVDCAGKEGR